MQRVKNIQVYWFIHFKYLLFSCAAPSNKQTKLHGLYVSDQHLQTKSLCFCLICKCAFLISCFSNNSLEWSKYQLEPLCYCILSLFYAGCPSWSQPGQWQTRSFSFAFFSEVFKQQFLFKMINNPVIQYICINEKHHQKLQVMWWDIDLRY